MDTVKIYDDECDNYVFIIEMGISTILGAVIEKEDINEITDDVYKVMRGDDKRFTHLKTIQAVKWKKKHTPLVEIELTGGVVNKGRKNDEIDRYIQTWKAFI